MPSDGPKISRSGIDPFCPLKPNESGLGEETKDGGFLPERAWAARGNRKTLGIKEFL